MPCAAPWAGTRPTNLQNIRDSVSYASNTARSPKLRHAIRREMDAELADKFVGMYVNKMEAWGTRKISLGVHARSIYV